MPVFKRPKANPASSGNPQSVNPPNPQQTPYGYPPQSYPGYNQPPNSYSQPGNAYGQPPPNNYPQPGKNNYGQPVPANYAQPPPNNYSKTPPPGNYPQSTNKNTSPLNNQGYNLNPLAGGLLNAGINANGKNHASPKAESRKFDTDAILNAYRNTIKEFDEEMNALNAEAEDIKKRSKENDSIFASFQQGFEEGHLKKELLQASINNTKE